MIHKKSRTTGKRPRRTGENVAQNTSTDFLALRLRVVLSLLTKCSNSGIFKQGGTERGDFGRGWEVRQMFVRGVRRHTVPSRKCDYPLLVRGVLTWQCAQHLPDGTVSVRRGQSAIAPSSPEALDCRSPWLRSPLFTNAQPIARFESMIAICDSMTQCETSQESSL